MRKSRLTVWMSCARVIDQNPSSSGKSLICRDQCTGHSERICRNSSWGGPSSQSSRSIMSTWSRSRRVLGTGAILLARIP